MDATLRARPTSRPGWEPGTSGRRRGPEARRRARRGSPRAPRCARRWPTGARLAHEPMVGIEFEAYLFEPDGARWLAPDRHARGLRLRHRHRGRPARGDRRHLARQRRGRPSPRVGQLRVRQRRSSSSRCATPTRCAPPTTASSSSCSRARSPRSAGSCSRSSASPLSDRGGSGLHLNSRCTDDVGRERHQRRGGDDGLSALAKHCDRRACSSTTAAWPGCARRRSTPTSA